MPTNKTDAQAIGSATTYARRYAYQSILNIAAESDDDGNDAVSKPFPKKEKPGTIVNTDDPKNYKLETDPEFDERTEGQRKVSKALVDALVAFANSQAISGIPSPADLLELTRDEFEDVKKQVMARAKTPATAAVMAPVASVPIQTPKGPVNTKTVSEPQIKRMMAIAHSKGVAVGDVDIYLAETFGLASKKDLNRTQYDLAVQWIEAQ